MEVRDAPSVWKCILVRRLLGIEHRIMSKLWYIYAAWCLSPGSRSRRSSMSGAKWYSYAKMLSLFLRHMRGKCDQSVQWLDRHRCPDPRCATCKEQLWCSLWTVSKAISRMPTHYGLELVGLSVLCGKPRCWARSRQGLVVAPCCMASG